MAYYAQLLAGDNVNSIIRQTILHLQSEFFSMVTGQSSVSASNAFLAACSNFDSLLRSHEDVLEEETRDLLLDFCLPSNAIATHQANLESQKKASMDRFSADIVDILEDKTRRLSLHDPIVSIPAYIEPSARWLKDNLRNPYPSTQLRLDIARTTGTELKDINAWFTDARKRIGWNELRRKHFDNKRARIVEAASLFYSPDKNAVSLYSHIQQEFASIAIRASQLYERFSKSQLSYRLEAAATHYPTPEPSPSLSASTLRSVSPSLSLYESSSPTAGRKRSRSDSPEVSQDEPSRSSKRLRQHSSEPIVVTRELSSPALSIGDETFFTPSASPEPSPARNVAPSLPAQSASSSKRKRCVSEEFHYPSAKRHQPRAQAVSDPLPSTAIPLDPIDFSLEDFFSPIAPVVSTQLPDSGVPLEISFGSLCDPFQYTAAPAPSISQAPPANVPLAAPMDATLGDFGDFSSFHYTAAPLNSSFAFLNAPSGQFTLAQNELSFPADFSAFDQNLFANIDFSQVDNSIPGPSATHQPYVQTQPLQHTESTLSVDEARAALDEAARLEAQARALRARVQGC
ncbi:mating-type protein beta 1 [Coprinopsis sp. MPI-PUGE-AT-0042]|nr:mating-type protein beta 1 [Coprinopsis sp. MPI-PUGE-AT-0042]